MKSDLTNVGFVAALSEQSPGEPLALGKEHIWSQEMDCSGVSGRWVSAPVGF
jgi:hypothetical protein